MLYLRSHIATSSLSHPYFTGSNQRAQTFSQSYRGTIAIFCRKHDLNVVFLLFARTAKVGDATAAD